MRFASEMNVVLHVLTSYLVYDPTPLIPWSRPRLLWLQQCGVSSRSGGASVVAPTRILGTTPRRRPEDSLGRGGRLDGCCWAGRSASEILGFLSVFNSYYIHDPIEPEGSYTEVRI